MMIEIIMKITPPYSCVKKGWKSNSLVQFLKKFPEIRKKQTVLNFNFNSNDGILIFHTVVWKDKLDLRIVQGIRLDP